MSEEEQLEYALNLSKKDTIEQPMRFLDGNFDINNDNENICQENAAPKEPKEKPVSIWANPLTCLQKYVSPRVKDLAAKKHQEAAPKLILQSSDTSSKISKEDAEDEELKKALAASIESHKQEESMRKLVNILPVLCFIPKEIKKT